MVDFMQQFVASKCEPIEYMGHVLHCSHRIYVSSCDRVHLFFDRFREIPAQGLCIAGKKKHHKLEVNGHKQRQFVLWPDRVPKHVEVVAPKARKPLEICLYNVWWEPTVTLTDGMYAGGINYGMRPVAMEIEKHNDHSWELHCSDGSDFEADFQNLVVRVVHEPCGA